MNSHEDEGDDIYQVPRSSLELELPIKILPAAHEEPPILMPKKTNPSQRKSSLLDRQSSNVNPQPPPRHLSSNKNVNNVVEPKAESIPVPGIAQQASSTKSVDLTEKESNQTVEALMSTPIETSGDKNSTTKSTKLSADSSTQLSPLSRSNPDAVTSEVLPINTITKVADIPKPGQVSATRPVPTPRPRTKLPSSVPQNPTSNVGTKDTDISSLSTLKGGQEQSHIIIPQSVNNPSSSSAEKEENRFTISCSFPPDADSIELMLNDEVDKKYGLHSEQNKDPKSTEVITQSCNLNTNANLENGDGSDDDYVNPDGLIIKGKSSNKGKEKICNVLALPKPHSAAQTPSYLHMNNTLKQEHISATELSVLLQRRSVSPLSDLNINIGSHIFDESSTDDFPEPEESSGKESDVNHSAEPSTPKPFNDIQPFRSKVLQHSDVPDKETEAQSLDFSYFDPLWTGQTKTAQSSYGSLVEQLNFVSADKAGSSSTLQPMFTVADQVTESSESYYSQIDKESKSAASAHPWKLQNRKSFHHDAPLAPPPPLPRQQDRIPEPVPPPVPPRPNNAPGTFQPPITSKATTVASTPFTITSTDLFQDLPTPAFMENQSSDPFQDSKFDYECHKFNKTQVPAPPSRNPLPKSPAAKFGASSSEISSTLATIDPSLDPERISRFVIPPPSSLDGSLNTDDYDLARELSSSDSECLDNSSMDNSMQGWPPCGVPISSPLRLFDGNLSPKKTSRYGYLFKQGGYKANKGWKKRWVVFSGTSLSYYSNNTSQVSKRIIPVRCMVSTQMDIKDTDKNNFKFKVLTSLKDRVFIFSSETLDDCIIWASMLEAAIAEYKKSFSSGDELPPDKPDKEGFIKFSNLKKYYVTISGKTLCYYQTFEDFQMGSPTHEIDMKLCSVKVKDHKKLQLWIHYGHFDMTFDSDQELQQWRMAMEDAIAEGLSDDTVLNKVYENLSNHFCADCSAENPHWASINLGIVVCKNCAGVHRMFDYRISKIRSLRMDTRVWTPSLIEIMVTIGNANANAFWESELPVGAKIKATESMDKRKEYITKKYKGKKFCSLHPLASCGPALGEALLSAASVDNVLELMKILFSGVDVLFRKGDCGSTAYDMAKEHGQRLIMEILYQNGGDPQSLEQNVKDENRLREDIRLQGFLNKTGPIGKTFEKRWCLLEHGTLTYYLNEKSKTFKGSIDRKDMLMIQAVDTERLCYTFELSTRLKDNRIFIFSSESRDDSGEWIRTIAKLMAPVAVMDHVGMIDIKLAGFAYMKESLVDEWRQTFIVFSCRTISYMNRDLKFDYIDLRKASSIKMQDSSNGYQQRGQCFVISSTGKSVYLQATLPRDTEKMFTSFLEASMSSGPTLNDQALTNENVPVIVERCITHVHMNGLEEKGIYRTAGQNSKVQTLLDDFRKDAWSVSLSEYTVQDVANVLKRFLRELNDSVFEKINYGSWISMAGCQERNNRVMWYKYYLEKMPLVNYQTLKRIILHLVRVSQSHEINLMIVPNLASCFAPSLMRTANDEQPNLRSDTSSKEIAIVIDLMSNSDYFFSMNDNDRVIQNKIQKAEIEIKDKLKSAGDSLTDGILTPFNLLCREGQSINILITENKTAKEAMADLKRNKAASDLGNCIILHEQLFKGALERPLFPEDLVAVTTKQWAEWENWVHKDNNVCLCVQGSDMLEKLHKNFDPNHVLLSKQHYCDCKPKSKFKRIMVGFRQCKLALYNDQRGSSESNSWNVEDITIYLGTMHKKALPPTRYCLTFTVNGEKYAKPPFGHCLSFDTEDELYRWAAAMYMAQHPGGLLSWVNK